MKDRFNTFLFSSCPTLLAAFIPDIIKITSKMEIQGIYYLVPVLVFCASWFLVTYIKEQKKKSKRQEAIIERLISTVNSHYLTLDTLVDHDTERIVKGESYIPNGRATKPLQITIDDLDSGKK